MYTYFILERTDETLSLHTSFKWYGKLCISKKMSTSEKKKKERKKRTKDKVFLFMHNKESYLEALLSLKLIFSLTYLVWIHNLDDIWSKVSTVTEIISSFFMAKLFTLVMLKWITLGKSDFSCKLSEIGDTTLVITGFTNECPVCIWFWLADPISVKSLLIDPYQQNSLECNISLEIKKNLSFIHLLVALLWMCSFKINASCWHMTSEVDVSDMVVEAEPAHWSSIAFYILYTINLKFQI